MPPDRQLSTWPDQAPARQPRYHTRSQEADITRNSNGNPARPTGQTPRPVQNLQQARRTQPTVSYQQLQLRYDSTRSQLHHVRLELEGSTTEIGALNDENAKLQKMLQERNKEIEELTRMLASNQAIVDEQDQIIKNVQEQAFQAVDQGGWLNDEDASLNSALELVEKLVKEFCKKNAMKGMSGLELLKILHNSPFHQMLTMAGENYISAMGNAKAATYLSLSAWLSNVICLSILEKPLSFLNTMEKEMSGGPHILRAFGRFHKMMRTYYEEQEPAVVHTLRSDLARALWIKDPKSEGEQRLQNAVAAATSTVCCNLAKAFFGRTKALIDLPEKDAVPMLQHIMEQASEVAMRLATQRSGVDFQFIAQTREHFQSGLRGLEPHAIHNIDLDDDEKALDGMPILLLTHPLVFALGKSDGSDYSQKRLLKPAVVWMGKP